MTGTSHVCHGEIQEGVDEGLPGRGESEGRGNGPRHLGQLDLGVGMVVEGFFFNLGRDP